MLKTKKSIPNYKQTCQKKKKVRKSETIHRRQFRCPLPFFFFFSLRDRWTVEHPSFSFFPSSLPLPSAAEKRRATKKLARAASASVRRPVVNIHRRVGGRMTNDLNLHPNFIPRYRVIGSHSLPNWMRRRWVAPAILVEILFGGRRIGERSEARGEGIRHRAIRLCLRFAIRSDRPSSRVILCKIAFSASSNARAGYAPDNQVYDWESWEGGNEFLFRNEFGGTSVIRWIICKFFFFFARFEFLMKS